jgi:uncharacterized protein YecE (DUF72 family)
VQLNEGKQLGLFGDAIPAATAKAIGPAPVADELKQLAAGLPPTLRMGTSSWSFPGWQGIVYDRKATKGRLAREGLAAYSSHPLLRTVGLDRTYYAPLPASDLAAYAEMAPDDFRFLVKASNECTSPYHRDEFGRSGGTNPSFLDPGYARDQVVSPFVEGLREKGGTLLFQFPPLGARIAREPSRFAERLGGFLESLPRGPRYTVELRNRELLGDDYFAALRNAGAGHCYAVHPRMPSIAEQRRMAGPGDDGPLTIRWMLHAGLGYEQALSRYEPFTRLVDEDPENREELADLCVERIQAGQPVIVVANNKAEGSAPLTVFSLANSILGRMG